eukprot:comp23365_c0_seq1/m.38614 comp23365_c0_seq1/g.38614  ORF comp23365_c0_seq1/g.38614 comp23365_c0_seq1/m.38614 type:complete len:396 (-) comp23365_c0_seq1:231-1418(-)
MFAARALLTTGAIFGCRTFLTLAQGRNISKALINRLSQSCPLELYSRELLGNRFFSSTSYPSFEKMMKAVRAPNNDGKLVMVEVPKPELGHGEVIVKVAASGVNRLDILQKNGKYPVPPGVTDVLGVEVSGTVSQVGEGVSGVSVGDRVCALIDGGGYAEYCLVPAYAIIPLPNNMTFVQGAAIPEAWLTAYSALFWSARMAKGESALIHAGASGVGLAAVQLVSKWLGGGSVVYATAGSEDKVQKVEAVGARKTFNYKTTDFSAAVVEANNGKGVNVVVDFVGGSYLDKNLKSLCLDGRMVLLGLLGGPMTPEPFNMALILRNRLSIVGSTLRNRGKEYKARLAKEFTDSCLEGFSNGSLQANVYTHLPVAQVDEAHRIMEANENVGKIILTWE